MITRRVDRPLFINKKGNKILFTVDKRKLNTKNQKT